MDNNTIPFSDLKPSEQQVVHAVLLHCNWAALFLSLVTIGTYLLFQAEFPRSMPLWLAVSCTMLHSVLLIGPISNYSFAATPTETSNHVLCYIQGNRFHQKHFLKLFRCLNPIFVRCHLLLAFLNCPLFVVSERSFPKLKN